MLTDKTKIRPATPLPWEVDEEATICGNNSAVAFTRRRESAYMDEDAAYIAHAANAYPKLVEALRALHKEAGDFYGTTKNMRKARALLRQLGEDK